MPFALVGVLLACLLFSATASAAPQTKTFRTVPRSPWLLPGQAENLDISIPTPGVNGYITKMDVEVVDAVGKPIPINRLMLHHIVFSNLGAASARSATARATASRC